MQIRDPKSSRERFWDWLIVLAIISIGLLWVGYHLLFVKVRYLSFYGRLGNHDYSLDEGLYTLALLEEDYNLLDELFEIKKCSVNGRLTSYASMPNNEMNIDQNKLKEYIIVRKSLANDPKSESLSEKAFKNFVKKICAIGNRKCDEIGRVLTSCKKEIKSSRLKRLYTTAYILALDTPDYDLDKMLSEIAQEEDVVKKVEGWFMYFALVILKNKDEIRNSMSGNSSRSIYQTVDESGVFSNEELLVIAIGLQQWKKAAHLLNQGVNVNCRDPYCVPVISSVIDNEKDFIFDQILSGESDLDIKDYYGLTPIFYAAHSKSINYLERLLAKGANVNSEDVYRNTALYHACKNSIRHVRVMLDHGANPLNYGILTRDPLFASLYNDKPEIAEHLISIGVPLNRDYSSTGFEDTLSLARSRCPEIYKLLESIFQTDFDKKDTKIELPNNWYRIKPAEYKKSEDYKKLLKIVDFARSEPEQDKRVTKARSELHEMASAVSEHDVENGPLDSGLIGTSATGMVLSKDVTIRESLSRVIGNYFLGNLSDPWGASYRLNSYAGYVKSYGSDYQIAGTTKYDRDILAYYLPENLFLSEVYSEDLNQSNSLDSGDSVTLAFSKSIRCNIDTSGPRGTSRTYGLERYENTRLTPYGTPVLDVCHGIPDETRTDGNGVNCTRLRSTGLHGWDSDIETAILPSWTAHDLRSVNPEGQTRTVLSEVDLLVGESGGIEGSDNPEMRALYGFHRPADHIFYASCFSRRLMFWIPRDIDLKKNGLEIGNEIYIPIDSKHPDYKKAYCIWESSKGYLAYKTVEEKKRIYLGSDQNSNRKRILRFKDLTDG